MRLYAAVGTGQELRFVLNQGFRNVLVSYAGARGTVSNVIMKARKANAAVFLDSGAFAAFNRGHTVNLDEYIDFAIAMKPVLTEIACLDVIGDSAATERNYRTMVDRGVAPLQTVHFGQDPKEVVDILSVTRRGALGGMASAETKNRAVREPWLDRVFNELLKSSAWPIRVHGYGMSDSALMERYPWASVDSTSWFAPSWYGSELTSTGRLFVTRRSPVTDRGRGANFARAARGCKHLVRFGDYCTRLWEARGHTFE